MVSLNQSIEQVSLVDVQHIFPRNRMIRWRQRVNDFVLQIFWIILVHDPRTHAVTGLILLNWDSIQGSQEKYMRQFAKMELHLRCAMMRIGSSLGPLVRD